MLTDNDLGLRPVLSLSEAASFLGCNVKTIREAISLGQLPARRLGHRRLVILRSALVEWLNGSDVRAARKGGG